MYKSLGAASDLCMDTARCQYLRNAQILGCHGDLLALPWRADRRVGRSLPNRLHPVRAVATARALIDSTRP